MKTIRLIFTAYPLKAIRLMILCIPCCALCIPDTSLSERIRTIQSIPLPSGYERMHAKNGSFAQYLRSLPLHESTYPVYLYSGHLKKNQDAHFAVVVMSIGKRDLQQCADAIMRLRAEYLYSRKEYSRIAFNFTSGDRVSFDRWAQGHRPRIRGSRVYWITGAERGYSRKNFMSYLTMIFTYAGTRSLEKEMIKVPVSKMQVGDIFIQGGSPGHAVIIVDMAQHRVTRKKIFLLAQSYMPAQNVHVLKNYADLQLSPWYSALIKKGLFTPEWNFTEKDLRRFK